MSNVGFEATVQKRSRTIGAGIFTFLFAPLVAVVTATVVSYVAPLFGAGDSFNYASREPSASSQVGVLLQEAAIMYAIGLIPAAVMAFAFMRRLGRTGAVSWLYGTILGAVIPVALFLGLELVATGGKAALGWSMDTLVTQVWMAGIGAVAGLVTSVFLCRRA